MLQLSILSLGLKILISNGAHQDTAIFTQLSSVVAGSINSCKPV
jgi:hypothetical protein